jgi:hypothetical protein
MTAASWGLTLQAASSAPPPSTMAVVAAVTMPTRPAAIGRSRLSGWRRSRSRSAMSLNRYTADDAAQKTANAATASNTLSESPRSWANTSAAKTRTFLVH